MARKIVAILLDETGSMAPTAATTVSAINELIGSFRRDPDAENIDIYLTRFNSQKLTVNYWIAKFAPDLTDYKPDHFTPLLDAAGRTLKAIEDKATSQDKVAFIVQTDGEENASVEYTVAGINETIERLKRAGWDFTFIGADFSQVQAAASGASMGVSAVRSAGYCSASVGNTMKAVGESTKSYFSGDRHANAPLTQAELDAMQKPDDPAAKALPASATPTGRTPTSPAGPQNMKRTQSRWPTPS